MAYVKSPYPIRSYNQAVELANKLIRTSKCFIRIDDCDVMGSPQLGVRIANRLGVDIMPWDSFVHLWLQNRECDQQFKTKPFMARPK